MYITYDCQETSIGIFKFVNVERGHSIMKRILAIIGILSIAVGLLWIGQGTGYFPYPKQSFMISQMPWAYYGGALAAFGVGLVLWTRRMR
jgi:hypothetical protein